MAGNRNATPAQPTTGSAITDDKSRGGLFTNSNNTDINANAAQAVAVDTAEAEAAARAAAASAAGAATAAATATAAAGRAEMEADQAAQSAASARISEQRAEDWVEGPSHGGYTYRRAVRDDAGNLLGTWAGQDTPRTVEEYLMADAMTRGNFMIDVQTVEINATDDPTDTNNSQYWVGQAANGALEAAEAEVELLDAIARAASINVDIDFLQAMIAYTRFLDIGDRLLTTEQRGILDTNNVLPLSATISTEQFTAAGAFPTAGVIYSARAWSNLAQREANRAESEADAASNSANSAATAANNALAAENAAEAAANTATAASTAAGIARDAAIEARDRAVMAETNAEASENAALGSAELSMEWAQGTVTARADGSLGVDDSLLQAEPGVPTDAHSSAYWADTSHLWSGADVTRSGNDITNVNDASLQTIYPGAQSAAYWAWQAQISNNEGIDPWSPRAAYEAGHLVTFQPTGGANRVYEALVEITAPATGDPDNAAPNTPEGMMQWRDIAAISADEITVRTGSTVNTDTQSIEFNESYFNQGPQMRDPDNGVVINLDSEAVFMRWNAQFSYTASPASYVTFGDNLYKALRDSDSTNSQTPPANSSNDYWQLIDIENQDISTLVDAWALRANSSQQVPRNKLENAITYWGDTTLRTYTMGDIVFYQGNLFIAAVASPDNTPPNLDTSTNNQWTPINLSLIATNAGAISSLDGEIANLQIDITTNTDNITNISSDLLTIGSDIEALQMEIVDIPTSGDTTVTHGAIARVIGNNFNELYWRFGATVSGVMFSDFVGTNNSPRDNLPGYVRLSQSGGSTGTTVHYQNSQGNTLDLTEIEYDPRTTDRSAQILFTGTTGGANAQIDTVQLMEVYTEQFDPDTTPHLSAVRLGDTVYQITGGGPTHTPTLTMSVNHPVVHLYQDPNDFRVTYTGTITNGTLPDMDFATNVTITNVSPVANSLTRVNGTTFTFQVDFDTQNQPSQRTAHPANITVRNVMETDTGTHMDLMASITVHTEDGRQDPSIDPTMLRFPSTRSRADIITDDMPSIMLTVPGTTATGTAYDIRSFTRAGGTAENFTNGRGTYELVADDIPQPGAAAETITFTYNFAATPANNQPTANLTDSATVSRFNPWFLQAGATATATLTGDPVTSTDVIRDGASLPFTKAANQNIFLMTTGNLTEVRVGGSMFTNRVTQRGTETVNGVSFNKYQILRDDNLPAGSYTVEVAAVTT